MKSSKTGIRRLGGGDPGFPLPTLPEMLRYFPQLQQLDATDVTDYAALSDCISRFSQSPQCTIALNGTELQTDVQTLSLTNPSLAELRKVLPLLGNLRLLEPFLPYPSFWLSRRNTPPLPFAGMLLSGTGAFPAPPQN